MKTKLCILLCSIFMFGACTSDYEPPVPKNNSKQATRSGEPEVTMNEDSILRFRDLVCNASIKYQGFSDNMDFSWQLGGAYCNTTWKYDILYRWLY